MQKPGQQKIPFMKKIALLSDTHGWLDDRIFAAISDADEIWHGGDFGPVSVAHDLQQRTGKPLKGVFGNIDGPDIRAIYPETLAFTCASLPVLIQHIGGYPGKYAPGIKQKIKENGSRLFISGHSHILKIQFDPDLNCLHINPGAAGQQGWHTVRTLVTFVVDGDQVSDCKVIELGKRGR